MKYPSQQDTQILTALIHQVSKATPPGKPESSVKTIISLPMWRAFNRAIGFPEDFQPKYIPDNHKTNHTVYGSLTVIVASEEMFSFSKAVSKP